MVFFMKKLFFAVFLLCFTLSLSGAVDSAAKKKMCWAHLVSWGFDLVNGYDQIFTAGNHFQLAPFSDRILAGKYIQQDSGIFHGTRKQIETAMQWGIDGFCVDIIADPKLYKRMMARFFRHAEGYDFKIALCIDKMNYPLEHTAAHLADFIRTYREHPNSCLIDGKLVIFIYDMGKMTPAQFGELRKKLAEQNAEAYFIIQPMRETSMWDDPKRMSAVSRVSDGFYDFGCNGFSKREMIQRLANGRKYLQKENRPDFLCAGIAQGYIGQFSAFYRPYLNTGSLRHSWEAAIANNADWVCLTTWNDYIENTHFEPSVNNRFNLVRLNREYLYKWRKQTPPPRPAQAMLTYMEEAVAGNMVTLELLNFSYTYKESEAAIRLLEKDGKLFREYKQVLSGNDLNVKTFRLASSELGGRHALRVQFSVVPKGEKHVFRELLPIIRRPDWQYSVRTARASYDDLVPFPAQLSIKGNIAKARLQTWTWAGKVELLRNNWPVAEKIVEHTKKPFVDVTFDLPGNIFPEDCYVVRLTDVSDRVGYSNPVFKVNSKFNTRIEMPVIVTNCDFDESWPLWKERPRKLAGEVRKTTFREFERFNVRFDMTQEKITPLFFSDSDWKLGAVAGKRSGHSWRSDAKNVPGTVKSSGPDGKERIVWRFDGDDNITLTSRAFPHGPVTIEMWVRPEEGKRTLFAVAGTRLSLSPDMKVCFERTPEGGKKAGLLSSEPVPAGTWTHIAAVYSGKSLELFFNGKAVGKVPAGAFTFGVNAIPVIGNAPGKAEGGFKGDMAGFALYGGIPQNGKFQLK